MKGFHRQDRWLSLCGLNCGLCPMRAGGHCGGCGNGNQSCPIARCSLEQGGPEYCSQCGRYPCERYQKMDQYDTFITSQRQKADLERVLLMGPEAYGREQREKAELLETLLARYNDGRRKTFYFLAVNLLELPELREALARAEGREGFAGLGEKERCRAVAEELQAAADKRGVLLRLRKKKNK